MSIYQDRQYLIVHKVLVDSWEQCKDADVLLESPSAMAGVHIAEALREQFHFISRSWARVELRSFHRHPVLPDLHHALDKVCLDHYESVTLGPDARITELANSLMLS
jgi:hypothetical protein